MKTYFFSFLALLALASCGDNKTAGSDEHAVQDMVAEPATAGEMPDAVTQAWSASMGAYLELKEALVTSDLPSAQAAAGKLSAAIGGADMMAMGAAHDTWMATAPTVGSAAGQVASATTIDEARLAFSKLTPPMVAAIKALGSGGRELFVQFCPMAFENAGADWVSEEREVRNPYFGDKMLTCGKVTEEL